MLMTAITDGHTASDTITSMAADRLALMQRAYAYRTYKWCIQKRLIAAQLHSSASVQ
jgi:hypothetical protein